MRARWLHTGAVCALVTGYVILLHTMGNWFNALGMLSLLSLTLISWYGWITLDWIPRIRRGWSRLRALRGRP